MLKRIFERIPLDGMGYAGGWAEVCVNPSRKELLDYFDTLTALLAPEPIPEPVPEPAPDKAMPEQTAMLRAQHDARLADWRARVKARGETAEVAFMRARLVVWGRVQIDGKEWDLSTEDGYKAFGDEGDVVVTQLMHDELSRRRSERLKNIGDSFRNNHRKIVTAGEK